MSPEQARGRTVDKRTDIWAFGCVLYEMLTGAPAFAGDGVAEVLANVIKAEPDWTALPADTPAALRLCLRRCLQKDLRQRFHDIADVRLAMEGAFEPPSATATRLNAAAISRATRLCRLGDRARGDRRRVCHRRLRPPRPCRSARDPPGDREPSASRSAVAGDLSRRPQRGVSGRQDPPRLWLRPLDSQEARPLAGTDGALYPFWSPDSRSVAFTAGGVLKRIDLDSGLVRTLAKRSVRRRGMERRWNDPHRQRHRTALQRPGRRWHRQTSDQPAAKGRPVIAGRSSCRMAGGSCSSPWEPPDVRGVYLGSTADANVQRVSDRESGYRFMPPAHVLFARQGALWARRLSRDSTTLEGELRAGCPEGSGVTRGFSATARSPRHRPGPSPTARRPAKRSSSGSIGLAVAVGTVGQADDGQMTLYQLSRDGRIVAVTRTIAGNTNVWLLDTERGVPRRLTFDAERQRRDPFAGRHSRRAPGEWEIVTGPSSANGVRMAQEAKPGCSRNPTDEWHHPQDWSADGRYILYGVDDDDGPPICGRCPSLANGHRSTSRGRRLQSSTPGSRRTAAGSPTNRMRPDRLEIHVQPFPGPGPKLQVSVGGGTLPRWRRDGRELFYVAPDRRLMAVSIAQSGSRLETGPPRALFTLSTTTSYEPSPDGQRFLVTAVVSEASPITVILNWKPPGDSTIECRMQTLSPF